MCIDICDISKYNQWIVQCIKKTPKTIKSLKKLNHPGDKIYTYTFI